MKFKERLPYFLVGLFVGTLIAVFIFRKKNTEFNYGPNARVLKNIKTKKRIYSKNTLDVLKKSNLDTSIVSKILKNGDVDLWNKKRLDTCISYEITGTSNYENVTITVKNSDSIALIEKVIIHK